MPTTGGKSLALCGNEVETEYRTGLVEIIILLFSEFSGVFCYIQLVAVFLNTQNVR